MDGRLDLNCFALPVHVVLQAASAVRRLILAARVARRVMVFAGGR